jgi:two-component system sensor histidine kinase KdpD
MARGALSSIAAVALVTGAVYALRPVAPVLSLGVLYLFAVLPVSILFGLAYALPVAVVSELVFNFLFLPPVHTLALRDSGNWVALAVYVVTAVVVSQLSARLVATERVRRSDAIKTAVLRAVGHDLRSPLTAIRAASEGLGSDALEPGERELLVDTVRSETTRLDRVVTNLLDLSRLEVGSAEPQPELWTADMLAARALEQLGPGAARVAVVIPDELPPVLVDAAQIDRVLVNLLENALKFTAEPWAVELRADAAPGEVVFRVVDHGPGIDEADRERVFEPFERGGTEERGSGLGLAIARGFADANRSRLWVEAAPGGGAAFSLALPAAARAPA